MSAIENVCPSLAQLVERGAYTSVVPGSSPGGRTNLCNPQECRNYIVDIPPWSQARPVKYKIKDFVLLFFKRFNRVKVLAHAQSF